MAGIFISYRRDDSQGEALHLFENLKQHFGADRVFMDVIAIRPGEDFRKVIDGAVASCDVMITLIGKDWLERLTGARDFVRLETAAALKRDVRVIPVLVQGAAMPTEEALPDDLKPLAYRNAIEVSHSRWDYDVRVLVDALERVLSSAPGSLSLPSATLATLTPRRPIARMAAVGAVAALLIGGAGYWFWPPPPDDLKKAVSKDDRHRVPATSPPPPSTPEPVKAGSPTLEPPKKPDPPPVVSISVPALVGLKEADARDTLQRAGLVVGKRATVKRGDVEPGTVLAQSPKAGESVEKGLGVTINVAVADLRSVPNVVGKTKDAASVALRAEDLKVSDSSEQTDDVKAGTVARQRPAAGVQVKPGTVVDISVAIPATVEVPKVVGMARRDAEAALRSAALGFAVSERPSREPPDTVVGVDPPVGTRVKSGHVLDVFVAVADLRPVPELVGKSDVEAMALLRKADLRPMTVKEATSKYKPATVIRQEPSAGTRVSPGTGVTMIVAVPDLRPMPDLVGKSDDEAMALLRTAELRPMFSKEPTSKYKPGIVLRQEPSAGTRVSPGSEVKVFIATSMPRPPSEVPDVTGLPLEEAGVKLWTLASLAVKWDTKESTRDKQGVVVSQSPGPGVQLPASSGVTLTVAVTPNTCIRGYIWREAFPGDRVCVNPQTRVGAVDDNRSAGGRIERDPSKRHSGPDTCVEGLVWREARPGDHVCVVPEVRERTAEDNKMAASRIPRRLGPPPTSR